MHTTERRDQVTIEKSATFLVFLIRRTTIINEFIKDTETVKTEQFQMYNW